MNAGEPPDETANRIADEVFNRHQGFGLGGRTAPVLLQDGWTDDLFPVIEALRVYNDQRERDPGADVALQFGDIGHARGSNKENTDRFFNDQAARFFAHHLRGAGSAGVPRPGSVTTFTQSCPQERSRGRAYWASSWEGIHPGLVRFSGSSSRTVTSAGGNPATGAAIDPITGGGDACRRVPTERAAGTAVYLGPRSGG